jgi:hypothetical protein
MTRQPGESSMSTGPSLNGAALGERQSCTYDPNRGMIRFETNRRSFGTTAAALGVSPWAGGRRMSADASAATSAPATAPSAPAAPSGLPPVRLAPPDRQPADLKLPDPVTRKAGWAVVGLGQLALEEVMPAFRQCRLSQRVALVSGHLDKAHTVADAYGIQHANIYDTRAMTVSPRTIRLRSSISSYPTACTRSTPSAL